MMTRLVKALGAGVVLLAGLVGIPAALWLLYGNPLPASWDGAAAWDAVSTADTDGSVLVTAVTWVAWAAWLVLAFSIVLEVVSKARGVRAPRLPGPLGVAQTGVGVLVALVFGGAMTSSLGGVAYAMPAEVAPVGVTAAVPAPAVPVHDVSAAPAVAGAVSAGDAVVVVERGDTLSELSQEFTGKAGNWQTVYQTSSAELGSNPHLIYVGQQVTIPAELLTPAAAAELGASDTAETPTTKTPAVETPAVEVPEAPVVGEPQEPAAETPVEAPAAEVPVQVPSVPAAETPVEAPVVESPVEGPVAGDETTAVQGLVSPPQFVGAEDSSQSGRYVATGLAGLTAVGVVTLLGRRRASQQRRRGPGQRIAVPEAGSPAALVEAQLRTEAEPSVADVLDQALRAIAVGFQGRPTELPTLRAARTMTDAIEFYFTDATDLPAPFVELDESIWVLQDPGLLPEVDPELVPAPWPALLTVGLDEQDAMLLVNLEVLGSLTLSAEDPAAGEAVLSALIFDLLGSGWKDDLDVTVVGSHEDLVEAVGSDRIRYRDDLDRLLAELEPEAAAHVDDLDGLDVAAARVAGTNEDAWTPHLLVIDVEELTVSQHERLVALTETHPRIAVAAVSTAPIGNWVLEVQGSGEEAVLHPNEIELRPQTVDGGTYEQLLDLFRVTHQPPEQVVAIVTDDYDDDETLEDVYAATSYVVDDDEDEDEVAVASVETGLDADLDVIDDEESRDDDEWDPYLSELDEDDEAEDGDVTADVPVVRPAMVSPTAAFVTRPSQLSVTVPMPTPSDPAVADADVDDADSGDADVRTVGVPATDVGVVAELLASEGVESAVAVVGLPDPLVWDVPTADDAYLSVLGEVEFQSPAGEKPSSQANQALQLLVMLALEGKKFDGPERVDQALWPGRVVSAKKRNPVVSKARKWAGLSRDGDQMLLPVTSLNGYQVLLAEPGDEPLTGIRTDWADFKVLVGANPQDASTPALRAALGLVRGLPLTGASRSAAARLWSWTDAYVAEISAAIADAAIVLAERALQARDSEVAGWAISQGLLVQPYAECLWRLRLRLASQTGGPEAVSATVLRMEKQLDVTDGDLDPETVEVIGRLLKRAA